jgi:hypothetical protein
MKPLVLTGWSLPQEGLADRVLYPALYDFIWGQPPSADDLAAYLGPRTADPNGGNHWSGWGSGWTHSKNKKHANVSLAEFCQHYETVELWFDMRPRAQLQLVWLLDYFSAYPEIVAKLKLRMVDRAMIDVVADQLRNWRPPLVDIREHHLATARAAWKAYRSPTPEACLDLVHQDLSALLLLKPALHDLLEELPWVSTGLGASEMRMLEMLRGGYANVNPLFHYRSVRRTRVFGEAELGYLLEGLAFAPVPAITGLDEELRTIRKDNQRDRHTAMLRSRMSVTDFGRAVLAHKEDFSRHNPIDRWWGSTHLTNDNLWRWSPALVKP